jgi:hypothetical protein
MRPHTRPSRFLPAALAILAIAAAVPAPQALKVSEGSRLWFEGTSTVRDWNCQAGQLDAAIDADAGAPAAVLGGRRAVRTVQLTIPVAQLDCNGNRTMNGHMWKALESERHATIQFAPTSRSAVAGWKAARRSGAPISRADPAVARS